LDGYHFAQQQCKETLSEAAEEKEKEIPRWLDYVGTRKRTWTHPRHIQFVLRPCWSPG